MLATAIKQGLISKIDDKYIANYLIMEQKQLDKLQKDIFAPLIKMIEPETNELAKIISDMHKKGMPKANKGYIDYYTYVDLWNIGIYAIIFAAQDGKLYIPPTPEEGAPLTMVIVK